MLGWRARLSEGSGGSRDLYCPCYLVFLEGRCRLDTGKKSGDWKFLGPGTALSANLILASGTVGP